MEESGILYWHCSCVFCSFLTMLAMQLRRTLYTHSHSSCSISWYQSILLRGVSCLGDLLSWLGECMLPSGLVLVWSHCGGREMQIGASVVAPIRSPALTLSAGGVNVATVMFEPLTSGILRAYLSASERFSVGTATSMP